MSNKRYVYIIDGSRTPFLRARGKRGPFSASDLATFAAKPLLARQPFNATDLGEVIMGCVSPSANETNIARIIAIRSGCGDSMPAWTVQRNCASGLQAIDSAYKDIAMGRHELVMAGGTEAMSRSPVLFNEKMVDWLGAFAGSRNIISRLGVLLKFRPHLLKPVFGLLCGLTDPICGLTMGQTAEKLAHQFAISREAMDAFAALSHQRALRAQLGHGFDEIEILYDDKGQAYTKDDGIREDSSLEKLAKLKPVFDKLFGQVTAGNSSQITDGAAVVLLASEDAVKKYNLQPLGVIRDVHWAALDPSIMGLGPVLASTPILQRHNFSLDDIDYWEINEAFAVQVLACLAAWEDNDFCKQQLGLNKALGSLDRNRLNIDGGSIALGHPVGASGARVLLHLLKTLARKKAKRGIATLCIGGGQSGAMLVERV